MIVLFSNCSKTAEKMSLKWDLTVPLWRLFHFQPQDKKPKKVKESHYEDLGTVGFRNNNHFVSLKFFCLWLLQSKVFLCSALPLPHAHTSVHYDIILSAFVAALQTELMNKLAFCPLLLVAATWKHWVEKSCLLTLLLKSFCVVASQYPECPCLCKPAT